MKPTAQLPYEVFTTNSLQAYRFPILSETVNAVFTRLGGSSLYPWRSLNLGHAVGDSPRNVGWNFEQACRAINIDPKLTASCHLIHGRDVLVATSNSLPDLFNHKADAVITREPGLTLTMRFADCTPLLFYDPVTVSIGLAHAGWRGTMLNVMGAVVEKMTRHFGTRPADLRVVIGPSIGPCCYQVGDDVYQAAKAAFADPQSLFVKNERGMTFDMWQANLVQARLAGVENVIVSRLCTACNTDKFFSHRAEKGKTGRFGAFLGIPMREGAKK